MKLGTRLSHYQIAAEIGAGGMGTVYRATDTKLGRDVALKVLPEEFTSDPERLQRFQHEARAVAALNHPHVVTLFSVEEADGIHFLTMELLEGQTLADEIPSEGLTLERFFELALQITEALASAHEKGLIHRDLKPKNVMVTDVAGAKVLDFGLAKLEAGAAGLSADDETATQGLTATGTVMGTTPYMSPEQAQGLSVDARSDVFSLGCVLYEMLAGEKPFAGDNPVAVLTAVVHEAPRPLSEGRKDLPAALGVVIDRCLEKDPDQRWTTAQKLLAALEELAPSESTASVAELLRRPAVLAPTIALLLAAVGITLWQGGRARTERRLREETLPRLETLVDSGRFTEAFLLAREVEEHLPDDPLLHRLLDTSTVVNSIESDPPGAQVSIRSYRTPAVELAALGTTPLSDILLPAGYLFLRFELEGYEPLERAAVGFRGPTSVELTPLGEGPESMVQVPASVYRPPRPLPQDPLDLGTFWIDTYEVSNAQYQEFVDAGGYADPSYWTEPFVDGDQELTFDEAMERFTDLTGRPGPATWRLGKHPESEADYPVRGVSWYEAVAYSEFVGKSLPTVHHWRRAAGLGLFADILELSNFEGQGPAPGGTYRGMSQFGAYDMAGNVMEWCWNASGDKRFILGGAWSDAPYRFHDANAQSPISREPTFGFRAVRYRQEPPSALTASLEVLTHDFRDVQPEDDAIVDVYLETYKYDAAELEAETIAVDDANPYWIKETVSFDAGWGGQRMRGHLYVPRSGSPPFQTIFFMPGSNSLRVRSSQNPNLMHWLDFTIKSGRAVFFPVLNETFERITGAFPRDQGVRAWRDLLVQWGKELQRSLDYLQSRADIDPDRIAFYGLSLGAEYGPVYLAVERRFSAAVLLSGCYDGMHMPDEPGEVNPWNFAGRVEAPTILICGRHDFLCPVELAQRPMYEMLGPEEPLKRHALLEGGHLPRVDDITREALDWLDEHLGPVGR